MEIWKDIEGFEGYYQVSNKGRVRSLDRVIDRQRYGKQFLNGKVKQPCPDKKGYLYVHLDKNGKRYFKQVHRLVAIAFIPNPDNLPQVGHWDENPGNANVENLYWTTAKDNCNHGLHNERLSLAKGRPIYGVCVNTGHLIEYPTIGFVRKDGFNYSAVDNCLHKTAKTHKGYQWFYGN
ncbi:MAG: NUMOD4 motif-containing HNH endonuclease [Turicibacter sp.]|nr:NUMOD4 motif-containing HNH endonuclease [Turicibacter sp.]